MTDAIKAVATAALICAVERHIAYISVGSNIGDKIENCRSGVRALCADGGTTLLKQSPFYRTSPVDYEDQDWFVNAAVKVATRFAPESLLDVVRDIQVRAGRVKDPVRFGPRILDLDIIFYDDAVIRSEKLVVPHPRMHKRRFVLQPICDIAPFIVHPVLKKNMRDLLAELADTAQKVEVIR